MRTHRKHQSRRFTVLQNTSRVWWNTSVNADEGQSSFVCGTFWKVIWSGQMKAPECVDRSKRALVITTRTKKRGIWHDRERAQDRDIKKPWVPALADYRGHEELLASCAGEREGERGYTLKINSEMDWGFQFGLHSCGFWVSVCISLLGKLLIHFNGLNAVYWQRGLYGLLESLQSRLRPAPNPAPLGWLPHSHLLWLVLEYS